MMDIDFQCTKCGNCCKGLWVSLSVTEAIFWLHDGNPELVLCEAIPWPGEMPAEDLAASFKKERSFPAMSGSMPIRGIVTLAAPQGEKCPYLNDKNLCNIYDRRPQICRAYPAEKIPFVDFAQADKRCPPEAWIPSLRPFIRNGVYVDGSLGKSLNQILKRPINELVFMQSLCDTLSIREASLSNEGYVVHRPSHGELMLALIQLNSRGRVQQQDWSFVSDQPATVTAIAECDARCVFSEELAERGIAYLSLLRK